MMNLGDKTRSITIRLTPTLYDFVSSSAKASNLNPSQFIRMMIAGVRALQMQSKATLDGVVKEIEKNR